MNDEQSAPLQALAMRLREFARERDWDQFHNPKNLAAALSVEAGELLEHFQWLKESESEAGALSPLKREQVALEMADVLLYLVRLADRLDIDLPAAALRKLAINAQKYPIERARGSARKYDEP